MRSPHWLRPQAPSRPSGDALSGGSNRATALSLNVCPYRAKSDLHRRPPGLIYEGDNYSDAGGDPKQGQMDRMITSEMNTARMTEFLAQVSAAHRREFIAMVVDGTSSHVAKDLVVPKIIKLLRLPPYAPELNPQENVWDEPCEREFPNRVYADMAGVSAQLEAGLPRLAGNRQALRSLPLGHGLIGST